MYDKIFSYLKNSLPTISETERAALESGDVWIEADIFHNELEWDAYKKIELHKLTSNERHFIENELEELLSMVDVYKINEDKEIPEEIMQFLRDKKFFSFIIPKEYGGLDFSATANSFIVSKISSVSASLAVTVMVPNSLGPAELLKKYGTQEEKDRWLPDLAVGKEFPCFGLTSPFAGSDAGAIPDKGVLIEKEINGEKTLGFSLTIDKRYITLAPIATVIGLAFKAEDPNNLLGLEKTDLGITCALVPSNTEGVSTDYYHKPMNMAFKNGTIKGSEVFIPLSSVIGGKDNIGRGWEMLMSCLADGRGISLPALATAKGQTNFYLSYTYAELREQFGTSILNFEGIEEKLTDMLLKNYVNEATRSLTVAALDMKVKPAIVTAITKYHTTELSRDILIDSMDIMAGKSIIQGKSNPSWDSYIGMPIAITVEGANILTRNLIIFGQGAVRCHPFLLQEMEALENNDQEKFEEHLKDHMKFFMRKLAKTKLKYWYLMAHNKYDLKNLKQFVDYYSSLLAILSDLSLLLLGGKLKFKENLSARLGDMLSYLYMAIAVVVYYENNKTPENKLLAEHSLRLLLRKLNVSLTEFYAMFPNKKIMSPIKFGTSPFGLFNFNQKDKDNKEVLKVFQNKDIQKQLTNLVYFNNDKLPIHDFKETFDKKKDLSEVISRIKKEVGSTSSNPTIVLEKAKEEGVVTENEYLELIEYYRMLLKVISVDEFK